MRQSSNMNVSSKPVQSFIPKPTAEDRRSPSPTPGRREWGSHTSNTRTPNQKAQEQDAAVLQSLWGDDVKIRQGKALLKPSEIRNRTPGRVKLKDWGECPLTFDKIREPVRAGDGKVYECWAIKKWLAENGNRSPLTNVVVSSVLEPLKDTEEGLVKGERHVDSDAQGLSTEINTVVPPFESLHKSPL
ncbi:hypothetical protein T484DRAFT_1772624 [Baffinella frigidus]|nr:hypothetical protein T484DRAFT_1772624 [Cryptophyta sp. CCMP2293]